MKATDRCDKCSAQAYVQTAHSGNTMMWCAHHYEKYKDWLSAAVVIDERKELHA